MMAVPIHLLASLAALFAASGLAWGESAPSFADYPAAQRFSGRNAAPQPVTREARQFRTMIRNAAGEKPNFDGHFILTTWGCGSDCEMGAIIDAISGRVVMLPVVAGTPEDAAADAGHFDYRIDSQLLVMHGMIKEEPPMGSHYFVFDGGKLTSLRTIAKAEKHWDSPVEKQ